MKAGPNLRNFFIAQCTIIKTINAHKHEKKARNVLLFSSGSVGSKSASQFSLKKKARVAIKAVIETIVFINNHRTLGPKYCSTTPKNIMTTPRAFSIG